MTAALLTLPEAMEQLRVGRTTLYKLINDGQLQVLKIGRLARIRQAELDRFLATHQHDAA